MKTEQLLDPGYLKSRSKLIDMKRAQKPVRARQGGTVYLTAADATA